MLEYDELYSGPVVAGCGNSELDQRLEPVASKGTDAVSSHGCFGSQNISKYYTYGVPRTWCETTGAKLACTQV